MASPIEKVQINPSKECEIHHPGLDLIRLDLYLKSIMDERNIKTERLARAAAQKKSCLEKIRMKKNRERALRLRKAATQKKLCLEKLRMKKNRERAIRLRKAGYKKKVWLQQARMETGEC